VDERSSVLVLWKLFLESPLKESPHFLHCCNKRKGNSIFLRQFEKKPVRKSLDLLINKSLIRKSQLDDLRCQRKAVATLSKYIGTVIGKFSDHDDKMLN